MAKNKTGRPVDVPVGSGLNVTRQDFEQRYPIFPPSFIDIIVLKGGNEYVKAEDLSLLVSAIVVKLEELRIEMTQVKLHLASMSDENISKKDTED